MRGKLQEHVIKVIGNKRNQHEYVNPGFSLLIMVVAPR